MVKIIETQENSMVVFEAPELNEIEKSKADQIKAVFVPMAEMLKSFESAYGYIIFQAQKEITGELTARAKRLRLDIAKIRVEAEKKRKEQKEEYLRAGKAIDGVSNILKWAIVDKEEKLKEIEDYFQIQEQKRIDALQKDRAAKLSEFVDDAHERHLSSLKDDEFEALLMMKKKEKDDRIAAEKQAEEDRIAREKAEQEEREKIKAENEKLKAEAEERDRKEKIEAEKREKAEKERKAKEKEEQDKRDEEARREREAYEAKLKTERDEREKAEREERAKREKLEAELKAKEDAERKAKEEEEAKRQVDLAKGDVDKMVDFIGDLQNLKNKYKFESKQYKDAYAKSGIFIQAIIDKLIDLKA